MDRKKIFKKLAIPAAVIFIMALLILLTQIPYRNSQAKKRERVLENHITGLTEKYQNYLRETASKITSVPADPKIIGEIQSDILQQSPQIKLYMWMNDKSGDFIFGSPATAFKKLNTAFDKYEDNIKKDGHFINRNDFLNNLIVYHDEVDFTEFESPTLFKNENYRWRFFKEGDKFNFFPRVPSPVGNPYHFFVGDSRYTPSWRYLLSSAVSNDSGEVIGELYLKIDDFKNRKLYQDRNAAEHDDLFGTLNPILGILMFFSGLFLWFLLPAWVYTDARQRDARSPGLWAFLTLISLVFGLTIYLLARPSSYKTLYCPQCENELNGTKAFCPHCGFDLAGTFCPHCQYPVKESWQFCPSCRAELSGEKKTEEDSNKDQME